MRQEVLIQFQWEFPGLIYLFPMDSGGEFGANFYRTKADPAATKGSPFGSWSMAISRR